MFKLQADKIIASLTAAGIGSAGAAAIAEAISNCVQDLEHNGGVYIVQDQPRNSDPSRYATLTLKTNPGKRALNLLQGDAYFGGNVLVGPTTNITFNGTSGTSIAFRNDSGSTVPAGGVMQISGYVIKQGQRYLTIVKPASTTGASGDNTYPRYHAINGELAVGNGKTGFCTTTGYALALCDGATAFDQSWGAKPSQWSLSTGRNGFQTMGVAEKDGRTLVFQNQIVDAMGITLSDITQGSSGAVTIRTVAEADSGYEVVAYDRLLLSSKKNPSGSKVDLYFRNGKWWIGGADVCPT